MYNWYNLCKLCREKSCRDVPCTMNGFQCQCALEHTTTYLDRGFHDKPNPRKYISREFRTFKDEEVSSWSKLDCRTSLMSLQNECLRMLIKFTVYGTKSTSCRTDENDITRHPRQTGLSCFVSENLKIFYKETFRNYLRCKIRDQNGVLY